MYEMTLHMVLGGAQSRFHSRGAAGLVDYLIMAWLTLALPRPLSLCRRHRSIKLRICVNYDIGNLCIIFPELNLLAVIKFECEQGAYNTRRIAWHRQPGIITGIDHISHGALCAIGIV